MKKLILTLVILAIFLVGWSPGVRASDEKVCALFHGSLRCGPWNPRDASTCYIDRSPGAKISCPKATTCFASDSPGATLDCPKDNLADYVMRGRINDQKSHSDALFCVLFGGIENTLTCPKAKKCAIVNGIENKLICPSATSCLSISGIKNECKKQ